MVEFELLRSDPEPTALPVSKFPCVIGRGSRCDIRLNEPGVWVEHAELTIQSDNSFRIEKRGDGALLLNGESITESELNTSDILDLGGIKLRFRLSAVHPDAQSHADWIFWGTIALVVATMIGLMILLP
ncbi:MAG: FHA domain-containing protein [Limisphaerales bacterium]